MAPQICPLVDMLHVSKSLRAQRKHILKFAPAVGLTCINYRTMGEVDYFYLDCQNHRDYYRDPVHKMQRPARFCQYHGDCGIKRDYNFERLSEPVRWVRERQPVVYQNDQKMGMNLDGKIQIGAHFSSQTSTVFKR